LSDKRIEIANVARMEVRGHDFVSFDVAMNGYVISTIDAPLLSGRILWSHAAIHGFGDFDPRERTLLEAEIDRQLMHRADGWDAAGPSGPRRRHH
jgi:hypothetical protein